MWHDIQLNYNSDLFLKNSLYIVSEKTYKVQQELTWKDAHRAASFDWSTIL